MLPGLNPAAPERKLYSWKIAGEGRKCWCEIVDDTRKGKVSVKTLSADRDVKA